MQSHQGPSEKKNESFAGVQPKTVSIITILAVPLSSGHEHTQKYQDIAFNSLTYKVMRTFING